MPKKHPGGRETLLTPERQQRIISYIRAGAFDWVAAEANGIHRQTFWEWIKRGEDAHARPQTERYAEFAYAVREARAEARLSAEVEVKRGEPLSWLMKGPGRDRPGEPGWTDRPSQDALPHVTIILAGGPCGSPSVIPAIKGCSAGTRLESPTIRCSRRGANLSPSRSTRCARTDGAG